MKEDKNKMMQELEKLEASQQGVDFWSDKNDAQALIKELHDLKTVKRRETAERVDAARSLGDLSENAEYQEAKQQLGMIESRIIQLNEMLKNISVIESEKGAGGAVIIGSTVLVASSGKKKEFQRRTFLVLRPILFNA